MAGACSGFDAQQDEEKIGMQRIVMLRRSFFWKEVGCRNDSSTWVGRMKVSAELATRRKALKNTGSTTAWYGTRSDEGFLLSESGSKKARTSKNEWTWQRGIVEQPERKPMEKGSLQDGKSGSRRSTKIGTYQQKVSKVTLQLTIPSWVLLESGEHVVGQWCNWVMMKNWHLLHGMYGSIEAELEVQRTIKRAELTAFPCLLKKVIGPTKVYADNKGIIDGLWR